LKYEVNTIEEFEKTVFEAVQRRILAFSWFTTFPEFDKHLDAFIAHIADRVSPEIGAANHMWRRAWFFQLQAELVKTAPPTWVRQAIAA